MSGEDIEKLGLNWCCVDELVSTSDPVVIVNTDLSTLDGPGVHWLCVYRCNDFMYVYDPLGPHNMRVASNGEPVDDYLELPGYHTIYNGYPSQMKSSTHCGYFSCYIGLHFRDNPPATPQECSKIIIDAFGREADVGDEQTLVTDRRIATIGRR